MGTAKVPCRGVAALGAERGLGRQENARLFLVPAVQHCHVSNSRDQLAAGALRQKPQCFIPGRPLHTGHSHLDQLMIAECASGFGNCRIAEPRLPEGDHRFQRMRQAAQMFALFFGKGHGAILHGGRAPVRCACATGVVSRDPLSSPA